MDAVGSMTDYSQYGRPFVSTNLLIVCMDIFDVRLVPECVFVCNVTCVPERVTVPSVSAVSGVRTHTLSTPLHGSSHT